MRKDLEQERLWTRVRQRKVEWQWCRKRLRTKGELKKGVGVAGDAPIPLFYSMSRVFSPGIGTDTGISASLDVTVRQQEKNARLPLLLVPVMVRGLRANNISRFNCYNMK